MDSVMDKIRNHKHIIDSKLMCIKYQEGNTNEMVTLIRFTYCDKCKLDGF